ncbi:protein FAM8A1-like isoform X2 [Panulirus ornatus]
MVTAGEDSSSTGAKKKYRPALLKEYEGDYHTAGEYALALRTWMNQLYQWQWVMATFPYFLASLQTQAATQSGLGPTAEASALLSTQQQHSQSEPTPAPPTPDQGNTQQQQQPEQQQRGVEYTIPPLWKRLVAEAIDFLLLFVIKLAVTLAAVDAFDLLSDVEMFDFENLRTDIMADFRKAMEMTSELMVLELIHRIGTCVFEALCLHRGSGGVGGATPGKKVVGLRVVRCEWVAPTAADQALIYPATDLGLCRAVIRSVVKNFSLTFLFPICFTFFSFQHNRIVYDIIAGSIVVEEQVVQRRRNNNNVN